MKSITAHDAHTPDPHDGEHPLMFLARTVDRFFFRPIDPTTWGLIRISVGIVVLYVHLVYCIGLANYLGPDGWVLNKGWTDKPGEGGVLDFLRFGQTFMGPSSTWDDSQGEVLKGQTLWSIYYHVEDPVWIWVIHIIILVAMFLFTIGLGCSRVLSALVWIGALQYIQRVPSLLFGMDTMMNLALLFLMISPCGAALSVDRWLKVRRERRRLGPAYVPQPPEPLVSANFATRLMQISFCFIYLAAGTSKLLGTSWWNGTAPNRFLLNYSFAPFDVALYSQFIKYLADHRWMWEVGGAIGVVYTLFLELGFTFLVWNRRTRWFMVSCSILLHTMIALLMGLVTFSLIMMALVLAFVPPEVVRQWLQSASEQIRLLLSSRAREEAQKKTLALSR
ncbi:MAG TPA: HTTM domain-containing protein [Gemmataceae bacterium]|nr:HTTM domain-containing protein [Gemmataceae bacterium]